METYTINEFSQVMKVPKQTLRYYDKLGLICPERLDNGYRVYSEDNRLDLQLVLLLKKGAFSLDAIKQILTNRRDQEAPMVSLASSRSFITDKRNHLIAEISELQKLVLMLDDTLDAIRDLESCEGIDGIIKKVYVSTL